MKIIYHHRIRSRDGQYVHLLELVQALKALGHDVRVVGPSVIGRNMRERNRLDANSGWVEKFKTHCPRPLYELLELGYAVFAFVRLANEVRRFRPDLIYERYNLFLPSGVWAKKHFGLPLLLEINAPLVHERSLFGGLSLRALAALTENYAWRGADVALPVTGVLARMVEARGVPSSRIRVIPNGVNMGEIKNIDREAAKAELLPDCHDFILGFVGFLREWHDLSRVVHLLAQAGSGRFRFLVVGDGPARQDIEDLAARMGVRERITFTGVLPREQALKYMCCFDIALQPDVVDYASPLKLIEYLALGRPIVAPDKENIREIIKHGDNGLLFSVDDETEFEELVVGLSADSALRERLSKNACQTVLGEGLTWEQNAKRVIELGRVHLDAGMSGAAGTKESKLPF